MVDGGARNLIILSRSGTGSEISIAFKQDIENLGVCLLTPICDISDAASLKKALEQCMRTMPPIKGCLQATAVLRVCFPNQGGRIACLAKLTTGSRV